MLFRLIFLATFSLFLAACQTIGMKGSPLWHMTASQNEKNAAYRELCLGYGFEYGTPGLSQCIAQESRDSRSRASQQMNNSLQEHRNRLQQLNDSNRTINCTSSRVGRFVQTQCN